MRPIVQISLDLTDIDEALTTAALAMRAGVDWLEAGTPLILAYGPRTGHPGQRMPSPLDELREVVQAVSVPVQAVGGLSLEQAIRCPELGAPLVVLGAPLTIDADAFRTADGNLEDSLRLICEKIHRAKQKQ